MKRYNADNRHDFAASDILKEVEYEEPVYPLTSDESEKPKTAPLYAFHSIVDKTFFKPGLSSISQVSGAGRKPVYDSLPDGSMPDYGVNIAWVRSVARDRVDIDLALEVVRETVKRADLEDKDALKQAAKAEEQLQKLGEMIKSASDKSVEDKSTATAVSSD